MKEYRGRRTDSGTQVQVVETGPGGVRVKPRPLNPRTDLCNHSPTGFEWGYAGSGPAQLALALLADATGDGALAVKLHQSFKFTFVAGLAQDHPWAMTQDEILVWVGLSEPARAAEAQPDQG